MSDDLVKRLRDWEHVWPDDMDKPAGHLYDDAADRIEELEERLKAATDDAKEAEAYAGELEAVLESMKAKLVTCEKYRDAYAEFDRIATQAVRDLEAKLAKAVEFIEIVEKCGNGPLWDFARTTLAELTGGKDE